VSEQPILSPRDALRFILQRYDTNAGLPQGVWQVVKQIQRHLAWKQHVNLERERDRARACLSHPAERPSTSRNVR
jgi:hypothetical protein